MVIDFLIGVDLFTNDQILVPAGLVFYNYRPSYQIRPSNTDAKYTVHIDGKDATFRETSNNKVARTLAIDFDKDARLIEIIGTQVSAQ